MWVSVFGDVSDVHRHLFELCDLVSPTFLELCMFVRMYVCMYLGPSVPFTALDTGGYNHERTTCPKTPRRRITPTITPR